MKKVTSQVWSTESSKWQKTCNGRCRKCHKSNIMQEVSELKNFPDICTTHTILYRECFLTHIWASIHTRYSLNKNTPSLPALFVTEDAITTALQMVSWATCLTFCHHNNSSEYSLGSEFALYCSIVNPYLKCMTPVIRQWQRAGNGMIVSLKNWHNS